MDYEKEYKEALKRAKNLHKDAIDMDESLLAKQCEIIFPELAESEDEKIRKELIKFVRVNIPDEERYIAWLEKQSQKETARNKEDEANKNNALYIFNQLKDRLCSNNEYDKDILGAIEYCIKNNRPLEKEHIAWIEKQGEEKPKDKDGYTFKSIPRLLEMIEPTDRAKAYCQKLIDSLLQEGYAADAKIVSDCLKQMNGKKVAMATMDEQKNQVEPKFKVGNWYQCTKDFFGKGVTFDKDTAYYCAIEGCLLDGCHIAIVKDLYDNFKLWTIQDVKDGDILAFYDEYRGNKMVEVGIIEKYVGKHGGCFNSFKIYVGVNWDNNLQIGEYMGCSDIRPATEEQRDTLMEAMSNGGYTFDFEEKKLEKIEQNLAWSEEDESTLNGIIDEIEADRSEAPDYDIEVYDKYINWINSLKQKLDLVNKS